MLLAALCLGILQTEQHARIRVVASETNIRAGKPFLAAVIFTMDPHWHIYWSNPGDTGIPTLIKWNVPTGWKVEQLPFPKPVALVAEGLTSFVYEKEAVLLARITPSKSVMRPAITATAKWLVCQEACIPGSDTQKLTIDPKLAAKLQQAEQSQPAKASDWKFSASKTANGFKLEAITPTPIAQLKFFPLDQAVLDNSAPQSPTPNPTGFTLELKQSEYMNKPPTRLRGILTVGSKTISVDVPINN